MVSGGGPISRWPAIASANGRFILTPAATTVKVFSAVSGALTAVLTGHVAEVTAAVLAPNTESQARPWCRGRRGPEHYCARQCWQLLCRLSLLHSQASKLHERARSESYTPPSVTVSVRSELPTPSSDCVFCQITAALGPGLASAPCTAATHPQAPAALALQVWTASLDGTLRLWDFLAGAELQCIDLGDAIHSMVCARPARSWSAARRGFIRGRLRTACQPAPWHMSAPATRRPPPPCSAAVPPAIARRAEHRLRPGAPRRAHADRPKRPRPRTHAASRSGAREAAQTARPRARAGAGAGAAAQAAQRTHAYIGEAVRVRVDLHGARAGAGAGRAARVCGAALGRAWRRRPRPRGRRGPCRRPHAARPARRQPARPAGGARRRPRSGQPTTACELVCARSDAARGSRNRCALRARAARRLSRLCAAMYGGRRATR